MLNRGIRFTCCMTLATASLLVSCANDADLSSPEESDSDETADVAPNPDTATPQRVLGCRQVFVSTIPLYSSATSYTVNCRFLQGDVFQYTAFSKAGGGLGRYESWCPRHTPQNRGVPSWAPTAGTGPAPCPQP
jgi:hypothetical protein